MKILKTGDPCPCCGQPIKSKDPEVLYLLSWIAQMNHLPCTEKVDITYRHYEQEVADIIHDVGVPAHLSGYQYLREAIILAANDMDVINAVVGVLYPAVARKFNTTASRVERAIRHAIEVAWDRGDPETHQKYFGYTISWTKGKPTNSEFIAMISERLALKWRQEEQTIKKAGGRSEH